MERRSQLVVREFGELGGSVSAGLRVDELWARIYTAMGALSLWLGVKAGRVAQAIFSLVLPWLAVVSFHNKDLSGFA